MGTQGGSLEEEGMKKALLADAADSGAAASAGKPDMDGAKGEGGEDMEKKKKKKKGTPKQVGEGPQVPEERPKKLADRNDPMAMIDVRDSPAPADAEGPQAPEERSKKLADGND